jgi:hypothetical protein
MRELCVLWCFMEVAASYGPPTWDPCGGMKFLLHPDGQESCSLAICDEMETCCTPGISC